MALNMAMVTRAQDFVWTSYRGLYMLTDYLTKENHPESFHIAKLGSN